MWFFFWHRLFLKIFHCSLTIYVFHNLVYTHSCYFACPPQDSLIWIYAIWAWWWYPSKPLVWRYYFQISIQYPQGPFLNIYCLFWALVFTRFRNESFCWVELVARYYEASMSLSSLSYHCYTLAWTSWILCFLFLMSFDRFCLVPFFLRHNVLR